MNDAEPGQARPPRTSVPATARTRPSIMCDKRRRPQQAGDDETAAAGQHGHGLDPLLESAAAVRRTVCQVGRDLVEGQDRQVRQGRHARQGHRRIMPRRRGVKRLRGDLQADEDQDREDDRLGDEEEDPVEVAEDPRGPDEKGGRQRVGRPALPSPCTRGGRCTESTGSPRRRARRTASPGPRPR